MNNHISPQHIEHKKEPWYDVWNLGLGLGQAQTCGRVKLVNGSIEWPEEL